MSKLPQHRASEYSDFGVVLRRIGPNSHEPVSYEHQDDYYIFCLIEKGSGNGIIDFKEEFFEARDFFLIRPGQVHRIVDIKDVEGWALIVDNRYVEDEEKYIFENFGLYAAKIRFDDKCFNNLSVIISLLSERVAQQNTYFDKVVVRHLVQTFIGMVAEGVNNYNIENLLPSSRHTDILFSFRRLLGEHLHENRQPSYYSSLLNISTGYLNEIVKTITGKNVTQYIKEEIILRAKRLLSYSKLSVKEISIRLGIDDYSYFSRIFTKTTGISPTLFRQRNRDMSM